MLGLSAQMVSTVQDDSLTNEKGTRYYHAGPYRHHRLGKGQNKKLLMIKSAAKPAPTIETDTQQLSHSQYKSRPHT